MTIEQFPQKQAEVPKLVFHFEPVPPYTVDEYRFALDYWQQRCLAAEAYINAIPCDPDINAEQIAAFSAWHESKEKRERQDEAAKEIAEMPIEDFENNLNLLKKPNTI